jgi:hypothetical protein
MAPRVQAFSRSTQRLATLMKSQEPTRKIAMWRAQVKTKRREISHSADFVRNDEMRIFPGAAKSRPRVARVWYCGNTGAVRKPECDGNQGPANVRGAGQCSYTGGRSESPRTGEFLWRVPDDRRGEVRIDCRRPEERRGPRDQVAVFLSAVFNWIFPFVKSRQYYLVIGIDGTTVPGAVGARSVPWANFRGVTRGGAREERPTLCKTAKGRPGPSEWIVDKRLVSGNADAIMYGYIRESA